MEILVSLTFSDLQRLGLKSNFLSVYYRGEENCFSAMQCKQDAAKCPPYCSCQAVVRGNGGEGTSGFSER